jgi:hypothetical protein
MNAWTDGLLRQLARFAGLEFGDGDASLAVEWRNFPTGGVGLLVVLGLFLAVALILACYRREAEYLGAGRRMLLVSARLVAVGLAVLLLFEPRIVRTSDEEHAGHVLVLLDVSQSMAQRDPWLDPLVAGPWQELGVEDPTAVDRRALMERLAVESGAIADLVVEHDVHVVGFADDDRPLATWTRGREGTFALDLAPAGSRTDLGHALRAGIGRIDGPIAGVVVVGDGRNNAGPDATEVAALLENRHVGRTVFALVGDPTPREFSRILKPHAPERVFLGDPFEIRAIVETTAGLGEERAIPVSLYAVVDGGTQREFRERVEVTPQVLEDAGPARAEAVFASIEPDAPGLRSYVLEIDPAAGEPFVPSRHRTSVDVEVFEERTRVLLIGGGPGHEYRVLRNQLLREPTVTLSCWLQSADADFPQEGDEPLEALPTEPDELEAFDVMIVVDPDASAFPPELASAWATRVVDDGAGLWWICGEAFTLDAVRTGANTEPLVELLPVEHDVARAERDVIGFGRGFAERHGYLLTEDGVRHKWTRLAEPAAANRAWWSHLPGAYFSFPVRDTKPAASVLVRTSDPTRLLADGRGEPVLAVQFVGAGRVLWSGTDDWHDWQTAAEAYDRFVLNAIRYQLEGRLGRRELELSLGEERVELGASIEVRVELRTEGAPPPALEVRIEHETLAAQQLSLRPDPARSGSFVAAFTPSALGEFTFRLEHAVGDDREPTLASAKLRVDAAAGEADGPADPSWFAEIASGTSAILVTDPRLFRDALTTIESRTTIETSRVARPLWDHGLTIAVLLAVLAFEWLLRKRSNLL